MISGLGHTGGTLDKLESIPGFNVKLTVAEFRRVLDACSCAMIGQTEEIAPADRKLYALRDVTATVESLYLICASIMSKKLAEGIDALVLDVKTGSGAFMKQEKDAAFLAQLMVETGESMGKKVVALITNMDQPLGTQSLNLAASIFMGQTEAPLSIRPFLPELTESELMTVMTSGMAHISGGMMAPYIAVGGADAKHLLTAVIVTAPGTLLIAKMLVPETGRPLTAGRVEMPHMEKESNILGAIARGTIDGLHLALNVGAMLITFLALLALVNAMMGWTHIHMSWFPYSLQQVFGWAFAPVAWLIGIHWHDATAIRNLLGTRMVLNEFVAFAQLGTMKSTLDPRSFTIATFALCGFANLSSIGIQIGGIGALAPNQRGELARLGLRAMLAGTMANLMSA